ncbi:YdcF family protein [Natronobiforma cellulositropha]|uniref:YdcF family protein n=1 Tax=Natronobiforma cellulositropha TaxID=1679076 RepID=UPI0021D59C54|nr:YdcF family protein [Natronobiforma cellulositropha]
MVVVVLGHRLVGETIHPHLERRVERGLSVLEERPERGPLVFTGGAASPGVSSRECDVMAAYALERGIDRDRIRLEGRALDTIGNGYFSRRVVDGLSEPGDRVVVVTADYHAARAAVVFERCFGDAYEVDASAVVETAMAERQPAEERRLAASREFFEGVAPGDLETVGRRLLERHELYDGTVLADVASDGSKTA